MWELASIVVGHYCELNSQTGLIYVLLTNRRSKLIYRLASEIHTKALPVMPASDAETVHTFNQLYSRYGFIMVCLIYLLLLAGDIELNPGPVPKEYVPKRTKEPVSPKTCFWLIF